MEEHDTLSVASDLDVLSDDAAVGPLVRLAALAHALDTPGAPAPSRAALREGLAALGAAEPALDRAALVVNAHARAAGLTWPEIADAHGGRPDALARRHARRRERFTDYTPPLAPTLEAYTAHAADLLAPVLETQPLSPHLAHLAAERLGAVLLTAHWEQVDAAGVASWLGDDALSEPRQRLHHHYGDQAGTVRGVLNAHGQDPAPVQASLVDLMRAAVGANDLLRHLRPIHPGPRPAGVVPATDTGPNPPALPAPGPESKANVARAVADAGWPTDRTAAPVAELVDAVRLLALNLPTDQARPLRALTEAVDATDGEAMARAVGVLRGLDEAERAELLGEDGQRALEALPVVLPGLRPVPRAVLGAHGRALATLVADAGLPDQVAGPLERLHAAAAPHLAQRTGANRPPVLEHLAEVDRALSEKDARALAEAVHYLPTTGVDLFDASTLAGVGDALAGVLLALGDHAPTTDGTAGPTAATLPGPGWEDLTAAAFPSHHRDLASATAHLLEACGPLLDTGALGEGETYQALEALRLAVLHSRTAGLGKVLDDVLKLKPTGQPVKGHPQVADALTALINAYDHQ